MDDDQRRELFEQMRQRRKHVIDEIALKERRREQDAIFRTLMNRKGDSDERSDEQEEGV